MVAELLKPVGIDPGDEVALLLAAFVAGQVQHVAVAHQHLGLKVGQLLQPGVERRRVEIVGQCDADTLPVKLGDVATDAPHPLEHIEEPGERRVLLGLRAPDRLRKGEAVRVGKKRVRADVFEVVVVQPRHREWSDVLDGERGLGGQAWFSAVAAVQRDHLHLWPAVGLVVERAPVLLYFSLYFPHIFVYLTYLQSF